MAVHKATRLKFLTSHTRTQIINHYLAKLNLLHYPVRTFYGPEYISVVVSPSCNQACSMCWSHSNQILSDYPFSQDTVHEMSLEVFMQALQKFRTAHTVSFIGAGEPLLNPKVFDMIHLASDYKMTSNLQTNGLLLYDMAESIIVSELDFLGVSINGCDETSFANATGNPPGNFLKILEGIRAVIDLRKRRKYPLDIYLTCILSKENLNIMPDVIRMAKELGVENVTFFNLLPTIWRDFDNSSISLCTDDREVVDYLVRLKRLDWGIDVRFPALINRDPKKKHFCDYFWRQVHVDGDGRVGACSVKLLNLKEMANINAPDPFNSPYFLKMRKAFLTDSGENLPSPCFLCPSNTEG